MIWMVLNYPFLITLVYEKKMLFQRMFRLKRGKEIEQD